MLELSHFSQSFIPKRFCIYEVCSSFVVVVVFHSTTLKPFQMANLSVICYYENENKPVIRLLLLLFFVFLIRLLMMA